MSKHLTVSQTVELLEQLRAVVRDFAVREEASNLEFRTRNEAAAKRLANQLATQEMRGEDELRQAETTFTEAKQRLDANGEQRKGRIGKARKSSQRQASEKIDHQEGRKKYAVQKGTLDAERGREERLKQNDAWLLDFENQLTENRELCGDLERRAKKAFHGYRTFRRLLAAPNAPHTELPADDQLLPTLSQLYTTASAELARFRRMLLPTLFKLVPLWIWLVLILGSTFALLPVLQELSIPFRYERQVHPVGLALLVLLLVVYFLGQWQGSRLATSIAQALAAARRLQELGSVRVRTRHAEEIERIENQTRARIDALNQDWDIALREAAAARELAPARLDEKWRRVFAKHEQLQDKKAEAATQAHAAAIKTLREQNQANLQQLNQTHQMTVAKWNAENQATWQQWEAEWKMRTDTIYQSIHAANDLAENEFPAWESKSWNDWSPPRTFQNAAKFGQINADVKMLADAVPGDQRLALPDSGKISLPLVLVYPEQGSILFETKSENSTIIASLNNIIFRLLATSPVGKLSFTIIDPVKLGQNFATIMHLADYEENLISGRIWTQPNQIEEQLRDLNEHMEKVIQMYLRNEYETIADYNLEAGNIAEKYHFVVIADFPANFTDVAARRLLHIAASGARCGVYTLIHWDHRHVAPADFLPDDLRKNSVCINFAGDQLGLIQPPLKRVHLLLDAPPAPELATAFLREVGEANRGSNRVEVPFAQVAPPPQKLWSELTTEELRVAIGRTGATKFQYLSIGCGTRQHALIAGKTGSGKSTLFHVIITNLSLWCSPEEVEFYLIDFKKGVEFKGYADARLPHARVVAIESDREFGLSVLQRVDEELKQRGELFRKLGVQDIPGYRKASGSKPMPRSLLMIDEFQELFVEDDRISQAAAMLLDRIVRQGRAFGIHVLLGSQTLGGAYTLARTTLGQMVIRIALQCNEADAYLIMDENNPAPRLLSRPGEGIYNDMAGNIEGNSPFQAVWLSDTERDQWLERVRALADAKPNAYPGPIVFEGNAPADIRENILLRDLLKAPAIHRSSAPRIWLGAPNSIKGPTEAIFERRSGNNLLMVGQRDEAVLAMLSVSLIALAAQFPIGSARFVLLDNSAPGSPENEFINHLIASLHHEVLRTKVGDLTEMLNTLANDLKSRSEGEDLKPTTFLFIHGLQNFKKLRIEDDFSFSAETNENPASQFNKLLTEGASQGIHVICTLDTFNNVLRFLGRKGLGEFEMRILFQMSAHDSAALCDDPKASVLGLHRALFYNEHEGSLETFRPYAIPDSEWIQSASLHLARLLANAG